MSWTRSCQRAKDARPDPQGLAGSSDGFAASPPQVAQIELKAMGLDGSCRRPQRTQLTRTSLASGGFRLIHPLIGRFASRMRGAAQILEFDWPARRGAAFALQPAVDRCMGGARRPAVAVLRSPALARSLL